MNKWETTLTNIAKIIHTHLSPEVQKEITELRIREIVRSSLDPQLLTIAQAADYLGLAPKSLEKKARKMEIRHLRFGKYVRFKFEHLSQYLESQTVKQRAKKPDIYVIKGVSNVHADDF